MLGTEQKRAAAVTMLGKTVERCADQVSPPWLTPRFICLLLPLLDQLSSRYQAGQSV